MKPIYNILSLEPNENGYLAKVCFDPEHAIYKAHFPNNPVTPGVILLQICKQCALQILKQSQPILADTTIKSVRMLKFTGFIVPQKDKIINIELRQEDNTFRTSIYDDNRQYAKMQFTI